MPLRRKRRPDALTFREREEIAKGLPPSSAFAKSPAGYPEVPLPSAGSSSAIDGEGATIRIAARKLAENVNGLLRQYLPKGRDFSYLSQHKLDAIARKLNTRPKKILGYRTP